MTPTATNSDPAEVAGSADFPELDPAASFPYTPKFTDPAYATIKSPEWLNDVTLYHNRGDTTFHGDSNLYGDFFGLDDLFTEHPVVVEGLVELWLDIIERYDIDGMRVDTMKHVNIEFWDTFSAAVLDRTAADESPTSSSSARSAAPTRSSRRPTPTGGYPACSTFWSTPRWPTTLGGGNSGVVVQAFDRDDWYIDADTNASMLVTFFGNHDEGRMGYFISRAEPLGIRGGAAGTHEARLRPAVFGAGNSHRVLRGRAGLHRLGRRQARPSVDVPLGDARVHRRRQHRIPT